MTVFCNDNRPERVISPEPGPVKVFLPDHCSLKSEFLSISNVSEGKVVEIDQDEKQIEVMKINHDDWELFEADEGDKVDVNEPDPIESINDYDKAIEDDLEDVEKQSKKVEVGNNQELEIAAITIAAVVIVWQFCKFFKDCRDRKTKKESTKAQKARLIEFETKLDSCKPLMDEFAKKIETSEPKFEEYERRLCDLQKQIDNYCKNKQKKKLEVASMIKDLENDAKNNEKTNYQCVLEAIRTMYD